MGLLAIAFVALFVSAIIFAFWKGGAPERCVAVAFWIASLLTLTVAPTIERRFRTVEVGILIVDLLLLVVLLWVALFANQRWTLVAASLQIMIIMGHSAKAVYPDLPRSVYNVVTEFWPFLQLTVLVIGAEAHRRRKKREGYVRSWSRSPRP